MKKLNKSEVWFVKKGQVEEERCVFYADADALKAFSPVDVVFVGEAPWIEEVKEQRPFVGRAGKYLRAVLRKVLEETSFTGSLYVTNVCKTMPSGSQTPKPPTLSEIKEELPILKAELKVLSPKLIVCLGKTAVKALLPEVASEKLEEVRGSFFGNAFVTYHPSHVLRGEYKESSVFEQDVKTAFAFLSTTPKEVKKDVRLCFSIDEVKEFFLKAKLIRRFSLDVETSFPFFEPQYDAGLSEVGLKAFSPLSDVVTIAFTFAERPSRTDPSTYVTFAFPVRALTLLERQRAYVQSKLSSVNVLKRVEVNYESVFQYGLSEKGFEVLKRTRSLNHLVKELNEYLFVLERIRAELTSLGWKQEWEEEVALLLKELLERKDVTLVIQNPSFELTFFQKKIETYPKGTIVGTDLLDYLMGSKGTSLKELEKKYLFDLKGIRFKSERQKFTNFKEFLLYNAEDALTTYLVYLKQGVTLKELAKLKGFNSYGEVALDDAVKSASEFVTRIVLPVVVNFQVKGLPFDGVQNLKLLKEVEEKISALKEKLGLLLGVEGEVNVKSDSFRKKIEDLCEEEHKKFTATGKFSLDRKQVQSLYHKTSNATLKEALLYVHSIGKLEGVVQKYLYPYLFYPYEGRVYSWYKLTQTSSGRLSCQSPNVQQVPRDPILYCPSCLIVPFEKENVCPKCGSPYGELLDFKKLFSSPKGLCHVDFSQVEMRVLAELSRDEALVKVVNDGLDVHSLNASLVTKIPYEEFVAKKDTDPRLAYFRQKAKAVTFAVIYGATAEGLSQREEALSLEEARAFIDTFYEKYPKTKTWIETQHDLASKSGYVLSPIGRVRRFFTFPEMPQGDKNALLRQAQNTPIQSYASDLTLLFAYLLFKSGVEVVGAVHDSIVVEGSLTDDTLRSNLAKLHECKALLQEEGLTFTAKLVENLTVKLEVEKKEVIRSNL